MRPTVALADEAGRYISSGVIQISVTNAAVIGIMVIVFILALVVPFPGQHHRDPSDRHS